MQLQIHSQPWATAPDSCGEGSCTSGAEAWCRDLSRTYSQPWRFRLNFFLVVCIYAMVALELTRVQPSEAHAYKKAVEFLSLAANLSNMPPTLNQINGGKAVGNSQFQQGNDITVPEGASIVDIDHLLRNNPNTGRGILESLPSDLSATQTNEGETVGVSQIREGHTFRIQAKKCVKATEDWSESKCESDQCNSAQEKADK